MGLPVLVSEDNSVHVLPGPGRPPGMPNKYTRAVKDALCEAFEQRGGVPALLKWANDNETEFYKLWVRVAPLQVDITSGGETLSIVLESARRRHLGLSAVAEAQNEP